MNRGCFMSFNFCFLCLMHLPCTSNQRPSKVSKSSEQDKKRKMEQKSKGWKKKHKDRTERETWLGAVTGHPPVPLPAFFSASPTPPTPSIPSPSSSAGNRALFRRGWDEEIKRKLHRVLLFDKTREVESWNF